MVDVDLEGLGEPGGAAPGDAVGAVFLAKHAQGDEPRCELDAESAGQVVVAGARARSSARRFSTARNVLERAFGATRPTASNAAALDLGVIALKVGVLGSP